MEWHTEAIDQDARPLSPTTATLVQEPPKQEEQEEKTLSDGLDALVAALPKTDIAASKAATLRAILKNVRDSVDNALKLLDDEAPAPKTLTTEPMREASPSRVSMPAPYAPIEGLDDRVVEGVFDGQGMVGDDGKSYSIPPNYASKSKLVEGDMLKLTIGTRGNFIYKQIGPIERQRVVGTLAYDQETGQYLVVAGGRSWKALKASITYYRADAGDEAVILVPKNAPSKWAAVENIIKKTGVKDPS